MIQDDPIEDDMFARDADFVVDAKIKRAITRFDVETVRSLSHHELSGRMARLTLFTDLRDRCSARKTIDELTSSAWRFFVERLLDLDLVDELSLFYLDRMFGEAHATCLRNLLDAKIHAFVSEKFGVELRAAVFDNKGVDAVRMLADHLENFDANTPSFGGRSALRRAVESNSPRNVRFLLDLAGVDVDRRDSRGRTVLFYSVIAATRQSGAPNIARLLLECGNADVRVVDERGLTVFDVAEQSCYLWWDFLVARLAIDEAKGRLRISSAIRDHVISYEERKSTFDECCRELEALEKREIAKGVTMFDALTESVETLSRAAFEEEAVVAAIERYRAEHRLHALYFSTMKV